MSADRSASSRAAWARRKAGSSYQTAAERLEARRLDDLRQSATATLTQARFGRDLMQLAEWCVSTCLAGGSSVHTAYLVAGTFTEGLSREWAAPVEDAHPQPEGSGSPQPDRETPRTLNPGELPGDPGHDGSVR